MRDRLYVSTIDREAGKVARQYGLGIEIAEFCTAWNMDRELPAVEKTLKESGATYQCVVYEDAPHAIGPGRHTDADGWIKLAAEFWEEQCK